MGLAAWLLGDSSPSLCQMGSWPLEASVRWLGLDSWALELPLMEPWTVRAQVGNDDYESFPLSILVKGISSEPTTGLFG